MVYYQKINKKFICSGVLLFKNSTLYVLSGLSGRIVKTFTSTGIGQVVDKNVKSLLRIKLYTLVGVESKKELETLLKDTTRVNMDGSSKTHIAKKRRTLIV